MSGDDADPRGEPTPVALLSRQAIKVRSNICIYSHKIVLLPAFKKAALAMGSGTHSSKGDL